MPAEVDESEIRVVARESPRDARDHDLAAVRGRTDPCAAVEVDPDVAVLSPLGLARVHPHPHLELVAVGPGGRGKRLLRVPRGAEGIVGTVEGREERVALGVDLDAAVRRDRPPDHHAMEAQ